jgi:hypothetical protein
VPSGWNGHGDGSDPCLRTKAKPSVLRSPVISSAEYCGEIAQLAYRADTVMLSTGGRAGMQPYDHGWAKQTRVLNGVAITVFSADASLRTRILDSARAVTGVDSNGCAPNHPAAVAPATRPRSEGGVQNVGEVESVSVCSYTLAPGGPARLLASRTFSGPGAAGLVDAVKAAPAGSGPDDPAECAEGYGFKLFVLDVRGSTHDQEVVVRFSGCDLHGTDDGEVERRLTADVLRPLLTGPDESVMLTETVARLIYPDMPVK